MPHLYVIAGPNGAGKTTFAQEFLPHFAHCPDFVNADIIARDLSPKAPGQAALSAGRLMLRQIRKLARARQDFGFETTLSGKSYRRLFESMRKDGYKIHLIFLWLPDVNLAINRVLDRVRQGGHSIPENVIRRRFARGLRRFWKDYKSLLEDWVIFDNSGKKPTEVANSVQAKMTVLKSELWERLEKQVTPL